MHLRAPSTGLPERLSNIAASISLWPLVSIAGLIGTWWLITSAYPVFSPVLLPSPQKVWEAALPLIFRGGLTGGGAYGVNLLGHILASLERVLAGFALGAAFATAMGIAVSLSPSLMAFLGPSLQFLRQVPPVSFVPLGLIWFGLGQQTILLVIIVAAFWPVFLNVVAGMDATPNFLVRASQSLGATPIQVLLRVRFRAALPLTYTGLRVGFGLAWSAVVAAELIGASAGLGYLILHAQQFVDVPTVVTGMITIGLLGVIFDWLFRALEYVLFPSRR